MFGLVCLPTNPQTVLEITVEARSGQDRLEWNAATELQAAQNWVTLAADQD